VIGAIVTYFSELALIGALIVLNAIFAGSDIAMVSLRGSQVRALEQRGRGARVLARLIREPARHAVGRALGAPGGRPLNLLSTLMRPVIWLLGRATDPTVRAFGGDPGVRRDQSPRRRSAT
jgi:putative hemolysin